MNSSSFYSKVYRLLGGFLLGLGLVTVGLALFTARMAVYPWWYERSMVGQQFAPCSDFQKTVNLYCTDPLQDLHLEYSSFDHDIEVSGKTIGVKGWWVPVTAEAKGTVILLHGAGGDRRQLLKHMPYLHAAGLNVLLIDCWNHGLNAGDGRGLSYGLWESASVQATLLWMAKKQLPRPVVLMGTSAGAFTALKVAAQSPVVSGVVAESPFVSVERLILEFSLLQWAPRVSKRLALGFLTLWLKHPVSTLDVHQFGAQMHAPVLLIHGESDTVIASTHSKEIFELLGSTKKEMWIVPGGKHEALWNAKKTEYEKRVLDFIAGLH